MAKDRVFNPDYRGYGRMLTKKEMRGAMHTLAKHIEQRAIQAAPVGEEEPRVSETDRRHYAECFSVEEGVQRGKEGKRAYGQVTNDSDHALAVEFGAHGVRKSRVLRKALAATPGIVVRSDH